MVVLSKQLWGEIQNMEYNFKRNELYAEVVKNTTKQEALEFFQKHLNRESSQRKKLSVRIIKSDAEQNRNEPKDTTGNLSAPTIEVRKQELFFSFLFIYLTSFPLETVSRDHH